MAPEIKHGDIVSCLHKVGNNSTKPGRVPVLKESRADDNGRLPAIESVLVHHDLNAVCRNQAVGQGIQRE